MRKPRIIETKSNEICSNNILTKLINKCSENIFADIHDNIFLGTLSNISIIRITVVRIKYRSVWLDKYLDSDSINVSHYMVEEFFL